jgi:hypothetical protein
MQANISFLLTLNIFVIWTFALMGFVTASTENFLSNKIVLDADKWKCSEISRTKIKACTAYTLGEVKPS